MAAQRSSARTATNLFRCPTSTSLHLAEFRTAADQREACQFTKRQMQRNSRLHCLGWSDVSLRIGLSSVSSQSCGLLPDATLKPCSFLCNIFVQKRQFICA